MVQIWIFQLILRLIHFLSITEYIFYTDLANGVY